MTASEAIPELSPQHDRAFPGHPKGLITPAARELLQRAGGIGGDYTRSSP